jgi:hypothetical protein
MKPREFISAPVAWLVLAPAADCAMTQGTEATAANSPARSAEKPANTYPNPRSDEGRATSFRLMGAEVLVIHQDSAATQCLPCSVRLSCSNICIASSPCPFLFGCMSSVYRSA